MCASGFQAIPYGLGKKGDIAGFFKFKYLITQVILYLHGLCLFLRCLVYLPFLFIQRWHYGGNLGYIAKPLQPPSLDFLLNHGFAMANAFGILHLENLEHTSPFHKAVQAV